MDFVPCSFVLCSGADGTEQSQQEHEDMAITPDKQKKEQQHQPQNGPLDYAHICKCIAMFFVVAGVVLMFFETGLDPEQKEQIKRLHQLDGIPHAWCAQGDVFLDLFLFFFFQLRIMHI